MISLTQVLIWSVIAAVICYVGELLVRRRAPDGILGTILLGLLAISLSVGIFHFHIPGELFLGGIPLLSSIIAAALIGVWLLTKVIILTGIGDINVAGVPLLRALIGAIILVAVWHLLTYRAWRHRRRHYYRRG